MSKRPKLCVDLDGTLGDYSKGWQGYENIGDPFPGAVEFTHKLTLLGEVVIYTCRCRSWGKEPVSVGVLKGHVKRWLDLHGFAYDGISTGQGKPFATAYIDDRAVVCRPQFDGEAAYEDAIKHALALAKGT